MGSLRDFRRKPKRPPTRHIYTSSYPYMLQIGGKTVVYYSGDLIDPRHVRYLLEGNPSAVREISSERAFSRDEG